MQNHPRISAGSQSGICLALLRPFLFFMLIANKVGRFHQMQFNIDEINMPYEDLAVS